MLKWLPDLSHGASYGLIFVFGLLTSIHCIGMCGGIVMTSCIEKNKTQDTEKDKLKWLKPSFLYNVGRVISYSITGALVGGLGQVISLQGKAKGIMPLVGGLFMLLMGLNLFGVGLWIKKLLPRMPLKVAKKIYGKNNYSAFYIGLLSGLMPCGPIQILQVYALGTASVIRGATSMFIFALGTVPLLFAFGAINTLLTKKGSHRITKFSSVIVIIMGISMLLQGLALMGINVTLRGQETYQTIKNVEMQDNYQVVRSEIGEASFPDIVVVKDIPVRWLIEVPEENYNECNKAIVIPEYGIEKELSIGTNVVEFTPTKAGNFGYTCWMGMIKANIRVVENTEDLQAQVFKAPKVESCMESNICDQCSENQENTQEAKSQPLITTKESQSQNHHMAIAETLGGKISAQENNKVAQLSTSKKERWQEDQEQESLELKSQNQKIQVQESQQKENQKQKSEEQKNQGLENRDEKDQEHQEYGKANTKNSEEKKLVKLQGYLQDKHCFNLVAPEKDTLFCLMMKECMASGYGIVVVNEKEGYTFYGFDQIGQTEAIEILNRSTKECGVKIKVTGYISEEKIQVELLEEIQ